MKALLDKYNGILAEAAVIERLRRNDAIQLHEALVHAPLIYSDAGRLALQAVYQEYMEIAEANHLPLLICTPTWRANQERVNHANVDKTINVDAVKTLQGFVEKRATNLAVKIGGLIGCKNDCYLPNESLSTEKAKEFHTWQINQLATGGVDFLIAATLPSVQEAAGIALAMEETGLPYILSFVIGVDGKVLDGSSLEDAIDYIDSITTSKPLGYFLNCSYPSFLLAPTQPSRIFKRLIGMQANASSLSHAELDGASELKSESLEQWGDLMIQLNKEFGMKVLGGCCGTDGKHLDYLARHIS